MRLRFSEIAEPTLATQAAKLAIFLSSLQLWLCDADRSVATQISLSTRFSSVTTRSVGWTA